MNNYADIFPAQLRCEYKNDPLNIDVFQPRLSWIVNSKLRCQKQTAYHIMVSSNLSNLRNNIADLWNSGKVISDETIQIEYNGKKLKSRTKCFWKVMLWNDKDCSKWSKPASWTMGLLNESDWKASWIGYDKPLKNFHKGGLNKDKTPVLIPPRYLRKDFSLEKPVRRAIIYSTALGLYEMSLNGRKIGYDYFNPGWTDYDKRVYYRAYEVTQLLNKKQNTLGAILGDGWYAGFIGR